MKMIKNKNGNKVKYVYEGTFGGVRVDERGIFYAGFGTEDIRAVPALAEDEVHFIARDLCMSREQFNKLTKVEKV